MLIYTDIVTQKKVGTSKTSMDIFFLMKTLAVCCVIWLFVTTFAIIIHIVSWELSTSRSDKITARHTKKKIILTTQ